MLEECLNDKKRTRDEMENSKMCNYNKILFSIIIVLVLTCFSGCTYNPPAGYTKEHHSREELATYARTIDPDATVGEMVEDTKEESREYRVYSAAINGMECHVASISQSVYNEGLFAGEFAKTYYRMDTDYDYYVIRDVLYDHPELGMVDNETLTLRFQPRDIITSITTVDDMTGSKLDFLFEAYLDMDQVLREYPLHKKHRVKIITGDKNYFFTEPTPEEKKKVHEQMVEDGILNP